MIYFLPIGVLFLAAAWIYCSRKIHRKKAQIRIKQGLQLLSSIRQLLEHLPQHRGSANALLNGDASFQSKLTELQKTIKQDISDTNKSFQLFPACSAIETRWQTIQNDWQHLRSTLDSLSPEDSFEEHTNLIAQIIYFMQDVCDKCQLNCHPNLKTVSTVCFHQLPTIIELCGQARGIGTGAAARGSTTTATHIKLSFLHQHLETVFSRIDQSLDEMQSHLGHNVVQECRQNTQTFLDTLSNEILSEKEIQIGATDFFERGSAAIAASLTIVDTFMSKHR